MKQPAEHILGIDNILKKAYHYWSKTLIYQLLFSLLYFSIFLTILLYFSSEYGLLELYTTAIAKSQNGAQAYEQEIKDIIENPNYIKFYYLMLGTVVFLYPLNLGFFKMYRKMDLGEKPEMKDLFAGYEGITFFKFASYYLFWMIVFSYLAPTIILGVFWILITLFTAPLMFFMDKRIFECFSLNFRALTQYAVPVFVGLLVAFLFKVVGALTLLFLPFTWPFMNAMIYTLYSEIFKEHKEKISL